MARMIIKESEIRQYVRSLIREAIEAEGSTYNKKNYMTPKEARREFARYGIPYDRETYLKLRYKGPFNRYVEENGLKPIDGFETKSSDEQMAMSDDERAEYGRDMLKKNQSMDDLAAKLKRDAKKPQEVERTPEELEYDKKIAAMSDDEYDDHVGIHTSNRTEAGLDRRIAELKAKQAAHGPRCDANEKYWADYDRIIKDTERIKREMYGEKSNKKDITDDDAFLDAVDTYVPTDDEKGDNYVDPNLFARNIPDSEENDFDNENDDMEDLYQASDARGGKRNKKRNFDDVQDFYTNDDDYNALW